MIGLVIWVVWIGLAPWVVPQISSLRQHPSLLLETPARAIQVTAGASEADVAAGAAQKIGQAIVKPHVVLPAAVFFKQVGRVKPQDPNSLREGIGRFNVEAYSLHLLGAPVQHFSPAGLLTSRWLFDGVFPFVLLIAFSLITPASDRARAERFYAKMKTPVAPTPEEDRREVELSHANPNRFDHLKLLPSTQWEMAKWTRKDFAGFFGCWCVVGLILVFLWALLKAGS